MAGTDSRFDSARFREAIRFAMNMGAPETESRRVTFKWKTDKTYDSVGPSGRPYSWTSDPVTEDVTPDVQIDCAVEFSARPSGSRDTELGHFDTSSAVITLLDEDYSSVATADYLEIDGNTYEIDFWGPALGLFDVTVHQIYAQARDES